MPVTVPHFDRISFAEANPFLTGVQSAMQIGGSYADMLKTQLENQKARQLMPYNPLTTLADAASKIAFARLMGPQFAAKMLSNPDIAASMQNPTGAVNAISAVGTQDPLGPAINHMLDQAVVNAGGNLPAVSGQPQYTQPSNGTPYTAPNSRTPYGQQPVSNVQGTSNPPQGNIYSGIISEAARAYQNSPAAQQQMQRDGYIKIPPVDQLLTWYNNNKPQTTQTTGASTYPYPNASPTNLTQPSSVLPPSPQSSTGLSAASQQYSQNAGEAAGIKEQGKELGAQRAKQIGELDQQYADLSKAQIPLERLSKLFNTQIYQTLRPIPFFQNMQLRALAKVGSPEQQRVIGKAITDMKTSVGDTVNSFKGRTMAKEFDYGNQIKINDNDTWNVAVGKVAALRTLAQATMQRNRIAYQLINGPNHLNLGDAMEYASKKVNIDAIENRIDSEFPKPESDKNKRPSNENILVIDGHKFRKVNGKFVYAD